MSWRKLTLVSLVIPALCGILSGQPPEPRLPRLQSRSPAASAVTDFFPAGPYVYGGPKDLAVRAAALNLSLTAYYDHLAKDVAKHGGTAIYYANLSHDPEQLGAAVAAAQAQGLRVFAQFTGPLYLRPKEGREHYAKFTLPQAKNLLPVYRELQGLAAWMPMEEPDPGEVALLEEYREEIRRIDPTHPQFTLHNNLEAFRADNRNLPEWFGFDRYRFRCLLVGGRHILSTPRDMASRLRAELADFHAEASRRNRPLVFVMQGYGEKGYLAGNNIRSLVPTPKLTDGPSPGNQDGNTSGPYGWTRYPPPENGMFLQCWLALLEGAKGLMVYYYGPDNGKNQPATLVDETGRASSWWDEYGRCLREIQPLFPLFCRWSKEPSPTVEISGADILVSGFSRPGDSGNFYVAVNPQIASWDEDSPIRLRKKTNLYFNEKGLAGLVPAAPAHSRLVTEGGFPLWDILAGMPLNSDPAGGWTLELGPGRGKVLYQGTKQGFDRLRSDLGLVQTANKLRPKRRSGVPNRR